MFSLYNVMYTVAIKSLFPKNNAHKSSVEKKIPLMMEKIFTRRKSFYLIVTTYTYCFLSNNLQVVYNKVNIIL